MRSRKNSWTSFISGLTSEVTARDLENFRNTGTSPKVESDTVIGVISDETLKLFIAADKLNKGANELGTASDKMDKESDEFKKTRDRALTLVAQGKALQDMFWNSVRVELSTDDGPNLWHGNDLQIREGGTLVIPKVAGCKCGKPDCPANALRRILGHGGEISIMTIEV